MESKYSQTTVLIDDSIAKQIGKGRKMIFSLILYSIAAVAGSFCLGRKVGKLEQKVDELSRKEKE